VNVRPPVPAIDVHTHLFPERLMAAVRRALGEMYGWSFAMTADPDDFASFVREHGTERFCILPYAHKPGMARSVNEWVAETAARLPGAIAFACVHPDDDDKERILADAFAGGARGVKLHYQVQNVAPDDERMFPVYEWMIAHDHPFLVHAGRGPTDNGVVGAERFRALMRRYPAMRVCVAHMGAPERAAFVEMLGEYPAMYLDTSGLGGSTLEGLGIEKHADRILFGTDAPNIAFDYHLAITRITDLNLGDDAERKIFRENALRFLAL
jgi:predicted TIM-barrel fold metal-dependent hydrolase